MRDVLGTDEKTGLELAAARSADGERRYVICTASGDVIILNVAEWLGLVELAERWAQE